MRVGVLARRARNGGRSGRTEAGPPLDRRAARRFSALSRRARIGWADGDVFVSVPAYLKDVSLSGLSVRTEVRPAAARVWVCLGDTTEAPWVMARVVSSSRERGLIFTHRPTLVRLRFERGCPYASLHEALGRDGEAGPRGVARPPGIDRPGSPRALEAPRTDRRSSTAIPRSFVEGSEA